MTAKINKDNSAKHSVILTTSECDTVKDALNEMLSDMFRTADANDQSLQEIEELIDLRNKFRKFAF